MKKLNSFSNHKKFMLKSNKGSINFLHFNINVSNGHLMINMYIKPLDCHQYLDYSSSHSNRSKHSIVYSQSLRARRLYSFESDFFKHCSKIKLWFLKKGNPENMIDEGIRKVKFSEKGSKISKGSKGVPFVVTYHPSVRCLSRIIKDNLNILYMSREAKAVFSSRPMVSFISAL